MELQARTAYWLLTPEEKKEICNGCGPKSAWFDMVPDTMWGLNISDA